MTPSHQQTDTVQLELLSPAKNLVTGIAAIDHGADAVYIGAARFGARAAAGNSCDDIAALCRYAHSYGAKVYATVNTIVYDNELDDTRDLLLQLIRAHVDAVLVQDMAVPQLLQQAMQALPPEERWPVALHASTQTDNRTAEKVRWLKEAGVTRVVLARELSIDEIRHIHQSVPDVELEAFVHGALCVSYSGQCYASQVCLGRSANRGQCAQMCRMAYDMVDADGRVLEHQRYLLSLKDMCRLDNLQELAEAGVCSFKIEGRLKDLAYVKNVTAAYSERLNQIVDATSHSSVAYRRASLGRCSYTFTPDVSRSFNRGFTTYGLHGREPGIANIDTPKALGQMVGTVRQVTPRYLQVSVCGSKATFSNGDGFCFVNAQHQLTGFRINRADGLRLYPQQMPCDLRKGMLLYRNAAQSFDRLLAAKSSQRKIDIDMHLAATDRGFELTVMLDGKAIGRSEIVCQHQQAEKPQHDNIVRQLTKLGGTPYSCRNVQMEAGFSYFIPSSQLAELRRQAVDNLCLEATAAPAAVDSKQHIPSCSITDNVGRDGYLLNISNKLARRFYELCGLSSLQPAVELALPRGRLMLMQCRHCLRYTLGHCVRHGGTAPTWHEPLFLQLANGQRFRLEFDCRHCQMNVVIER
ncbi:MAG: U32 family peptidase [Prevotella sp.]|nr:U32 family peptidase [Prevotella sp.]